MRIKFAASCASCDIHPGHETNGQNGRRLEEAAGILGFRVMEGSIICEGSKPRPEPFKPKCGALTVAPTFGFMLGQIASSQQSQLGDFDV